MIGFVVLIVALGVCLALFVGAWTFGTWLGGRSR
jgi:hypothetical protein